MRFEDNSYLWMIPVAILVIIGGWYMYRRHISKVRKALFLNKNTAYSWWPLIIGSICMLLLCVSLANPQQGMESEEVESSSSDTYIILDISTSMQSRDIAPSRLDRAKAFALDLVDALKGDRIGLIYMAGNSFIQLPMTLDYGAVKLALNTASPALAGTQGTDLGGAIELAMKQEDEVQKDRAVIIITDGESHSEGDLAVAAEAHESHVQIYTVGVGTEKGGLIPYTNQRGIETYKMHGGKAIVSKLNLNTIKEIARKGGGQAYMINQGATAIKDIIQRISTLREYTGGKTVYTNYKSYFQYPLFIVIAFLLFIWIKPLMKSRNALNILLFIVLVPMLGLSQNVHQSLKKGDEAYRSGDLEAAQKHYEGAQSSEKGVYNLGNTLYQSDDKERALQQFEQGSTSADPEVRYRSTFNKGVMQYEQQDFQGAMESFKEAIKLNNSEEAKQNYRLSRKMVQQQQQQQSQNQQSKDNKDDQQQQNKDQQQNQQQDQSQDQDQNKEQDQQDQQEKQNGEDGDQKEPLKPQKDLDKDEVNDLLKIAEEEEKKTQERLQRSDNTNKPEKDW